VDRARIDRWQSKPAPLIICESRSLAGVLRATSDDYCCHITSTNGQTRGSLITQVVPMMEVGQRILYFGDKDLSAGHIEENTRSVLIEFGGEAGAMLRETGIRNLDARALLRNDDGLWERVCITERQVKQINAARARRDLGDAAIMKPDNRFRDDNGQKGKMFRAVETEILGQAFIVNALKAPLDELLPEPLADIKAREEKQRVDMRKVLAAVAKRQRNQNGQ
jgi:hypothetical protein